MIHITAPHFVAGVVIEDGVATRCAPIVRYMRGWDAVRVARYCETKGWTTQYIPSSGTAKRGTRKHG